MGSVVDAWIGLAAVVAHAEACRRAALVIGKSLRQSGAGSDGWARQSGNLIKLTRGVPLAVAALAWHMSTSPERESQIRASVSLFSVVVAFACGLAAVPARQSTGRRATQYFASLVAMAALHFLWAVTLRTVVALYAPRGATGVSGRHAGLLLACAANAAASAAISPVVKACSSAALAPPAEQRLPRAPHPTPKRGVPPGWSARARPNAGIAAADGFALRQATLGPGLPMALMQARAVLPRDASSSPAGLLDVSLASALAPPLAEADRDAAMERVALKLGRRAEVNLQSLRVIAPEGARRGGADPMRTAVGLPDCWSDLVTIAHWAIQDSAGLHRLSLAALSYLAPVEQSVVPEGLLLDSEGQALPDGMPASQQQADAVSRLMALPVVPRAAKVCGEPSGLRYAREGRAGRAASPADAGAVAVAAASRAGWEAGLAPYVLASPDTRTNPLGTLVVVGGNRAELEGAPGVWDRDVCSTAGMRDGSVLELCRVRWLSRLTRLCKEDAAAAAERAAGRAEAPFLAAALQESAAHIRSGSAEGALGMAVVVTDVTSGGGSRDGEHGPLTAGAGAHGSGGAVGCAHGPRAGARGGAGGGSRAFPALAGLSASGGADRRQAGAGRRAGRSRTPPRRAGGATSPRRSPGGDAHWGLCSTPGPLGSRNLSTVEEEAIGSGSSEQGLSAAAELQSASAGLGFTSALLDAASSPGSLATSAHPCLQHLLRVWDDLLSRGLPGRPLVWLARGDAAAFVIEALRRREQALAATTLVIVTEPDARGMAAVQTVLAGDSPFSRRLLDGRMLVFERVHPSRMPALPAAAVPASGAGQAAAASPSSAAATPPSARPADGFGSPSRQGRRLVRLRSLPAALSPFQFFTHCLEASTDEEAAARLPRLVALAVGLRLQSELDPKQAAAGRRQPARDAPRRPTPGSQPPLPTGPDSADVAGATSGVRRRRQSASQRGATAARAAQAGHGAPLAGGSSGSWRPASGAGSHAPVGSWEREGTFASAVDPAAFSFASVDVDRDSAERGESASSADEAGWGGESRPSTARSAGPLNASDAEGSRSVRAARASLAASRGPPPVAPPARETAGEAGEEGASDQSDGSPPAGSLAWGGESL